MKDRRKKPRNSNNRRVNDRIFVDLDITTYINDEQFVTKMRNISGNGMQIVEPVNIEIQPEQDCQILIKDKDISIKLDASVVWRDFGLIGLCFKKQNRKIQKQLNKLSQQLLMLPITDKGMAGLV
jgi:PilZ domain-containing protein